MMKRFLLISQVVLFVLFAHTTSYAQGPDKSSRPIVKYPLEFAVSPPVRDLPPGREKKEDGEKERPLHRPFLRSRNIPDSAVQTSTPTLASAQGINQWEGLGVGYPGFTLTALPPDPNMAVGPNHIVQWVNNAFVVFDKQGNEILAPVDDGTFWGGLLGTCNQLGGFSDPIVQYDRMADRWIVGEVALPLFPGLFGQFAQCFAVSTTSDPTGSYYMWAYGFGTDIPDYPKISVWPDAYYVTFNIFHSSGPFVGPEACAWNRSAMLQGVHAPAFVCFTLNGAFYASLLPSDLDGPTPPPAGSPNFFMNIDPSSSALNMWSFHVNFANPQSSTFTGPVSVPGVAPFVSPCIDIPECIPQPGTPQKLDALADRLMYRLAYRNFGDHASIVANHTVLTPNGNTGVRWYEVRNPGPAPTLFQQGTFAPDSENRWMGSIAMDKAGNIGVGYSVASDLTYPSIRITGREVGDTPGELQTETFAVVGSGSQTAYDRWGDYSAMRIDPSNDCTFWYTQEYQASTADVAWNTRIISFQFPSCGQSLTPTTTTVVSSANPSTSGQTVTFTATVSPAAATGSVQFFDGATSLGTATLSGGTAMLSMTALSVGSHNITAAYGGNSSYAASTSSALTQTVNASLISTTTALTSSQNPSTFGQAITFTATVSQAAATGTVQFFDGGNSLGTVPVSGGTALFVTGSLSVGSHNITAAYSGDSTYAASTSSVLTQTVNAISTTTALTSSANPSTPGQVVTFTATVSPAASTGTVQFFDGGNSLGTVPLSGGTALFLTASLSVGSHSITATYGGDSTHAASTSTVLTQTVNPSLISTSTALASSANPSTSGQAVTFTATVSDAASTGTVQFSDGATPLGTVALSGGTASFSTAALSVGSHNITAAYGGDSTHAGSTSSVLTETVSPIGTTTSLTSSRNPSTFGQVVTFTATVSPAGSTGNVQFFDGGSSLGSATVSGGTASLSTSALAVGSHNITATYSGDSTHATSTSAVLTQTVSPSFTTTTALTSLPNPSTYGQSVAFTAVVSSLGGTPTGTVTFLDGATPLGSSALNASSATLSVSNLSAGTHTITAQYNGDGTFSGSASSGLLQTVNKANTTTTLTSNHNPSNNSQPVTFTAAVSPATATGTVQFFDGATLLGSAPLSGGVASLTTSTLGGGTHSVTASYGGDGNDNGSTSAVLTQTVRGKKN